MLAFRRLSSRLLLFLLCSCLKLLCLILKAIDLLTGGIYVKCGLSMGLTIKVPFLYLSWGLVRLKGNPSLFNSKKVSESALQNTQYNILIERDSETIIQKLLNVRTMEAGFMDFFKELH